MRLFAEAVWALYALRKPVVAAIGGHAVAGGCILALTADYRVLKRGGVQIGLNEVKVGVPLPWSVAVLLRASVPPGALTQVALLGRNFADDDALAVGLADQLADADGFEDFCRARLEEFADKDPAAVADHQGLPARRRPGRDAGAREGRDADVWLDRWFSDSTRERIRQIVAGDGQGPLSARSVAAARRRAERSTRHDDGHDGPATIASARLASASRACARGQLWPSSGPGGDQERVPDRGGGGGRDQGPRGPASRPRPRTASPPRACRAGTG